MITVTIPVGPYAANKRWLDECVDSVLTQMHVPDELLFIGDQADINWIEYVSSVRARSANIHVNWWQTPWLSGVAHAFNFGVALARNEYVIMLGSDDLLEPWATMDLENAIDHYHDPTGYYFFDIKYMDTGEAQTLPCNAAAVTKALWNKNGGFPVESAVGAPDTILISTMIGNTPHAGSLRHVASDEPPYLYRRHPETDTATRPRLELSGIRDILTSTWRERRARWDKRLE